MQFQLINNQGNEKKKARLQKELDIFSKHLQVLITQSHHLLASLRATADKKQVKQIEQKLKKA